METELNNNQSAKRYYKSQFPQPYIVAYGTSLGTTAVDQIDITRAFAPVLPGLNAQNTWALTRTGVGTFTLTHNLNSLNLYPLLISFANTNIRITAQTVNIFTLGLFTGGGVAVDGVFTFMVWALP